MYEPYGVIDTSVICPYNQNHRIARSRIQKHIIKCEKNYPVDYKVICPYNATHRLFKHEMTEHIITCPMRQLIEPELYQRIGNHALMKNKLLSDLTSSIDCNECWEDEFEPNLVPHINNDVIRDTSNSAVEIDVKNLRAPRGFSEAMLIDIDSETNAEDIESITSSMAMGRGKIIFNNTNVIRKIGLGRGKMLH